MWDLLWNDHGTLFKIWFVSFNVILIVGGLWVVFTTND